MTKTLFFRAIGKFAAGIVLLALLLFLPAWSLRYWNGWLFLGILFVPMFAAGIVMMIRNPSLLVKRLDAREKEPDQKAVIILSGLMFLAAFVTAGLNFRFGWFPMPSWAVWIGVAVFLAAYLLYGEVLRENTWLSRTIEVQDNQTVVDTGLYGVVRHPMYSATLFLFLSMGIVLGSLPSFLILLLYIPIIVLRIRNEEKILETGLKGYSEYKARVRYRLVPYIW